MRETFREREELYRPCIAEVVELECDGVPKVLEIRFDVVSGEEVVGQRAAAFEQLDRHLVAQQGEVGEGFARLFFRQLP